MVFIGTMVSIVEITRKVPMASSFRIHSQLQVHVVIPMMLQEDLMTCSTISAI